MLQRTSLIRVSGISSSYLDPKNPSKKLDIGALTDENLLAPDALDGLKALDLQVKLNGGQLYITDMYRTWKLQADQYALWVAGKRKDYVAPPGESWHNAGRAIDFDIYHLNFSCVQRSEWLKKLWDIAIPLHWHPIIAEPNMAQSEAWHFQHMGPDWRHLRTKLPDGNLASAAVLDCGMWNSTDNLIKNRYLQAQAMRVSQQVVIPDGQVGPKTKAILKTIGLDNLKIDDQIARLNAMPTPQTS